MKGFTLIEIIFAVSIFLMLMIAVFAVMGVGRGAWFTGDMSVALRQEMLKTFMRMEQELKETRPSQINLPAGATSASLTFKVPKDNDLDGTVLDSLARVEWSGNIVYALNGAKQITRTANAATTVLANNILSLQFSRPASPLNLLQVDITAQKKASTGRTTQDSEQILIKMRN
jgi:prepilin-type N-terminal cleavage/methylation domain-containing protein